MIDTLSQCTVSPYNVYSCFRDRFDLHDSNVVINEFGGSKVKLHNVASTVQRSDIFCKM